MGTSDEAHRVLIGTPAIRRRQAGGDAGGRVRRSRKPVRSSRMLALACFPVLLSGCAGSEEQWSREEVRSEITVFMDGYFQALLDGNRDAVTAVYHPDGASLGSYGRLESYDPVELRERYEWLDSFPPAALWWDRVRHEVLSRDAVLTTGVIGWLGEASSPDTVWITYTGVLVRTGEGWRVIHEQESTNVGPGS